MGTVAIPFEKMYALSFSILKIFRQYDKTNARLVKNASENGNNWNDDNLRILKFLNTSHINWNELKMRRSSFFLSTSKKSRNPLRRFHSVSLISLKFLRDSSIMTICINFMIELKNKRSVWDFKNAKTN